MFEPKYRCKLLTVNCESDRMRLNKSDEGTWCVKLSLCIRRKKM